jgi:hypothetical protein
MSETNEIKFQDVAREDPADIDFLDHAVTGRSS